MRKRIALFFFLCILLFIPEAESESQQVEVMEISKDNSEYKSIQIRFSTLANVDKYNIYYGETEFNNTNEASLHSRILVSSEISVFDEVPAERALDKCWYTYTDSFDTEFLFSAYRDDSGFPVIPSNSTNIVYNLVGLKTNVTYWFAIIGVDGEAPLDFSVTNLVSGSTEVIGEVPPSLDKTPIFIAVFLIFFAVLFLFYLLSKKEDSKFNKQGYLYSLPAFLLLCILTFYPIISGFYLSFTDSTSSRMGEEEFVGFENYGKVLDESAFLRVTFTTLLWTLTNVIAHVSIGLGLALLFNKKLYGKRIYRTILLLPWAIPSFISVLVWRGMFQPSGLVNEILGIEGYDYFSSTGSALTIVIMVNIWLGFPFMMMVFSGALQTIPKDLYEAAEIDGASNLEQFTNITVPLLKPTLIPVSLLGFIWTFNMFNVIFLMTSGGPVVEIGGPGGTDILITYVYDLAFPGGHYGLAAAWSVIIFFMLLIFSFYYTKVSNATEAAQ